MLAKLSGVSFRLIGELAAFYSARKFPCPFDFILGAFAVLFTNIPAMLD